MDALRFFSQAATVALIAAATRWLFKAKTSSLPAEQDGSNVYAINRKWRALAAGTVVFWTAVLVWSWLDEHRLDRTVLVLGAIFLVAGLWLSSGSVITDSSGITRRGLLRSRSFRWNQITEIRLHRRQGGAIELRAGSEKLVADFRLAGFDHLLKEIEDRTRLKAIQVA
jgi:hypothetical protein